MPKEATMHLMPETYAVPKGLESSSDESVSSVLAEDFAVIGAKLRVRLDEDNRVFAPRPASDGSPVVEQWIEHYKNRFLILLPDLFFAQFPSFRDKYQGSDEIDDLADKVFQYIKEDLRRYALRRLAVRWSASRYPDATEIGEPEKHGNNYLVPVFSLFNNQRIGYIALTPSGALVLPETSTGQELRHAIANAA